MTATLHFDGSYHWKTKKATGGAVLYVDGQKHTETWEFGTTTMNGCEFLALINGLKLAMELGVSDLQIRGDSKLVVNVVNGKWKAKKPHIRKWRDEAKKLLKRLSAWNLRWVPRHKNEEADAVSRTCARKPVDKTPGEVQSSEAVPEPETTREIHIATAPAVDACNFVWRIKPTGVELSLRG